MRYWRGMTLIELLATVTIIGVISAMTVPSLRGVQARQAMTNAQRGVQAVLYRMQQLSLAPGKNSDPADIIIGYAVAFHKRDPSAAGTAVWGCRVQASNDFLVTYKIVARTSRGGQIVAIMNPFTPNAPCGVGTLTATKYPNDIYVLPQGISLNATETFTTSNPQTNLPWLVVTPLYSAGDTYGAINPGSFSYYDPLPIGASTPPVAQLVLQHNTVKVGSSKLCKGVKIFRDSNGVTTSSTIIAGCS